ncbi:MAG: MFS transporter small subunit [Stellaceae bacterium]
MATQSSGNGLKLTLAWLFVGIPLAWGVIETLLHSLKLFE